MAPRGPNSTVFKMGDVTTQPLNGLLHSLLNPKVSDALKNFGSSIEELSKGQAKIKSGQEPGIISFDNDISKNDENNVSLRPEILLLTKFNPLYNDDETLTSHGELLENYINNLKILEAKAKEDLKNLLGEKKIKTRNESFKNKVLEIKKDLLELENFIKKVETFYKTLFLSQNKFLFKPGKFLENFDQNLKNDLLQAYERAGTLDKNLNLYSALDDTGRLLNVKNFSSSKIFLTSLLELSFCVDSLPYKAYKIPQIENEKKSPNLNTPLHNMQYVLPSFSTDGSNRMTSPFLTNQEQISFGVDEDESRFKYFSKEKTILNAKESYQDPLYLCKDIFTVILKDLDQQIKYFKKYGQKKSFLHRRVQLEKFIGNYPSNSDLTAAAKDNAFTGEKLSDLIFYRNLKNVSQKVLLLENTDALTLPEDVITGKKYVFAKDLIEQIFDVLNVGSLKNIVFDTTKIKDIKQKLDFLISKSYEQFVDLGCVFFEKETNPLSFLIDLRYKFLKNKKNDEIIFNAKTKKNVSSGLTYSQIFEYEQDPQKKEKKNLEGYGWKSEFLYPGFEFDENSLIAIFTGKGLTEKSKFVIINSFYNYIYQRANGDQSIDASYAEKIAINVGKQFSLGNPYWNLTPEEIENIKSHPVYKADVSSQEKTQLVRCTNGGFITYFQEQLQYSSFIKTLVDIFKKYIDLGMQATLPAFFYSIHMYISEVSEYSIKQVSPYVGEQNLGTSSGVIFQFSLNSEEKNIRPKIVKMFNDVSSYIVTSSNLTFAILNTLQVLKQHFDAYYNLLELSEKTYLSRLLSYLENDRRKLLALFEETQLLRALSTFDDVYQSYNTLSSENVDQENLFIKSEENFPHSSEVVSLLKSFFKLDEYRVEKGNNKQIISVGIPFGLFKTLYQHLDKQNIVNSNQNDIFVVSIYKIDLLNPYIIYRPKRFLFEASRFPVRIYSEYKKIGEQGYDVVPTRNFDLFSDQNFSIEGNIGANIDKCFGSKYDDISWWSIASSQACKEEILVNHQSSFLLENYLKLTSGLNANELTFNLNFTVLPLLTLSASLTTDQESKYISHILHPKKFDRVFNIIFDPEFEVDYYETTNTVKSNGIKESINKKLENPKFFNKNGNATYVDVDKSDADVSMNSYFVTVETYPEASITLSNDDLGSLDSSDYVAGGNVGVNPKNPKPNESKESNSSKQNQNLNDYIFYDQGMFDEKVLGSYSNESGYSRSKSPTYSKLVSNLTNWTLNKKF